jgi:hypothetical protein
MGTSNFHNTNASRVFAIEEDDTIYLPDVAEDIMHDPRLASYYRSYEDYSDPEGLRSYPAFVFGHIESSKEYIRTETQVTVRICLIFRAGYYSGSNLDWSCTLELNGYEHDLDGLWASDLPAHYRLYISRFLEKEKEKITRIVEEYYTKYTTPLIELGTASNGETFYRHEGK